MRCCSMDDLILCIFYRHLLGRKVGEKFTTITQVFKGFVIWIVDVEYLYRNTHCHLLTVCSLCQSGPNENGVDQSSQATETCG